MVSQLDLYSTICELIGRQPAHPLIGRSLLPLVAGEVKQLHEAILTKQTYPGPLEAMRAVRTERYKLVCQLQPIAHQLRHNGPPTAIMEHLGWYDRASGCEELFDLYLDPMEACNRASDSSYQSIKAELSARLDQ